MSKHARWSAALAVVVPALSACGNGSSGTSQAATGPTGQSAVSTVSAARASSTTSASSSVTTYQPADAPREATSPDPNFDYGFVVQITSDGFHPRQLVSGCCRPVTWKNLTSKSESVVFDHQFVNSGPIAPGGTFVYTPQHPVSITYHSALDPSLTGALQVNQEFDG